MCPGIGHLQYTLFLCHVTSEVSCECLSVPGDEIKVAFVREGFCEDKEIGLGKNK